jgi:23S rRNA pseudouridine2605 synthase
MPAPEPLRLQKFLADIGVCSRRAAEALIAQGEVWVNGRRAEKGQKVAPGVDMVAVSGRVVSAEAQPRITLAVHKPRGLICSNDDPHNPETVFSLVPGEYAKLRFFCAGRLDKDSEGLVILTTDGDFAHRLMHPSHQVVKRYHVTLTRPFPRARLPLLVEGVVAEGEQLKVEEASLVDPQPNGASPEVDVAMHHGKKREIRQLFTGLGFEVDRLRRYQIGTFRLEGIAPGGAKRLSEREIELLFRLPMVPAARPAPARQAVRG